MPNRLFYTAKFLSSFIVENNCNFYRTFDELLRASRIISLSDSQVLKLIRDITWRDLRDNQSDTYHNWKTNQINEIQYYQQLQKVSDKDEKTYIENQLYKLPLNDKYILNLNLLEYWYQERDRLKRRKNSDFCRDRIRLLQKKIYNMMYIPEYITVVIEDKKHYELFFKKGFYFNGEKYTRFSCSAGQARVSTVVFIKDKIKKEMQDRLNNGGFTFDVHGLSNVSFAPSKYNAYFGLYTSAIKEVTEPRFCIIPDFCETQKVVVDYIITTDDKSDDIVEEREIEVEFNRFDGNGLISPAMAKQWSKDIGIYTPESEDKGYIACQFCMRYSFAKGMLNTFDFIQWCEEKNNGNYIIKDIYGEYVDLRDIDVILTEGQTKCWDKFGYNIIEEDGNVKFIPSQDIYVHNAHNNDLIWGVTRYTPKEDDRILITNYQFLQTLHMSNEDIKELCKDTVEYLQGVSCDNFWYTLLFMLGENMNYDSMINYMESSDNYWLKSLICNPNLLNDKYTKEKIRDCLVRKIEQACMGKIMVDGNFQVIIPDSYAFMEWTCYRDPIKVEGLLKAGQCYSKFWKDRNSKKILSQRSPLTHFSECHLLDVEWNDEINKWFKYSYTGFYINTHDDSTMRWAGADFDYDIVASTNNPVMIRSVYKNQKPVTYDIPKPFKKQFNEEDLFIADCHTFGSLIGPLTNNGTTIVALISKYREIVNKTNSEDDKKKLKLLEDRLKMVCASQSRQIDKAKIGKNVKGIPSVWKQWQHIKDDDTEEQKELKKFYNAILCDRRPYFFKYLYKSTQKDYRKEYVKKEITCKKKFKMPLKTLINLQDKTSEQQQLINKLEEATKLIYADCEMNRICWYIESIDFQIKKKINDVYDFDYALLMSNDVKWNENTYNQIKEFFTQQMKELQRSKSQNDNDLSRINKLVVDKALQTSLFYEKLLDDVLGICSNLEELTNYIIKLFYEEKRSWNKAHVWRLCGEQIFYNCLKHCNYKIEIPERDDKTGYIRFCNTLFSLKEVDLQYMEDKIND